MSFFAFQDIITSVTGVLILVTLILASHLEVASDSDTQEAPDTLQERLTGLIEEQTRLELESRSLSESLTAAEAQPDAAKLEDDIAAVKARIAEEQRRLDSLKTQSEVQHQAARQRDDILGLTGLRDEVEKTRLDAAALASKDRRARAEKDSLEHELRRAETALLRAKSRQGQLWLIPDEKATTKEPILAVVARDGVTLERFDKPESRRILSAANGASEFSRFLAEHNTNNQYVVFYVRPSGVSLFNQLSEQAKGGRFEIGFDALEEATRIHFTKPPSLDDLPPDAPETQAGTNKATASVTGATHDSTPTVKQPANNAPKPTPSSTSPPASPTPQKLSWWKRFLRAIGLY